MSATERPDRPATIQAFERGDYATIALHGSPEDWQTHAAHGLIGNAEKALAGLAAFDHPEARFYRGVTYWIDGREKEAAKILASCEGAHAQRLLELIRKPKIRVLAQCDRGSQWDIITAIRKDPRFEVTNVGFSPNDTPNKASADVREFYDEKAPPDFYIAKMVEWHLLPSNLEALPCPRFGHTADYDLHIQTVRPWLSLFDELLTTDQTEWADVSKLTDAPVTVFPKAFSISSSLPKMEQGIRPMDAFISGTTFHPYHPDKARLLHQILANDELKVQIVEGFLPLADYFKILGHTRAAFTYIRHPGGMPTRGMEALAMGSAIAVQKESILRAYLGEEEGVVSYDSDGTDLPEVLDRISREWEHFAPRAQRGGAYLRKEFTAERTAGQYFRFLTFLAARPRNAKKADIPQAPRQKRAVFCKGWAWHPRVNKGVRQRNTPALLKDLEEKGQPSSLIDLTRELMLEYATWAYPPAAQTFSKGFAVRGTADHSLFRQTLDLFRFGIQRFPKSLVLRFNAIRAALYLGEPAQVSEALQWARETLSLPTGHWTVDPDEDVLPWDFFSQMFNYRAYFDACTRHWQTRDDVSSELIQLILASLSYHVSCYADASSADRRTQALRATRLDPGFPFYALHAAKLLEQVGYPESDSEAEALLIPLADNSMLLFQASALLQTMHEAGRTRSPHIAPLLKRAEEARKRISVTSAGREDWGILPLRPALADPSPASSQKPASGPIAGPSPSTAGERPRILYLCLEFAQWEHARRLAYPAGVGLEEGFHAHNADLTTLPSVCGLSVEARKAWQNEVRRRCEGRSFDQVWVELVHSEWDEEFWQWIQGIAPVRVGLIMESLRYEPEVYAQSPHLLQRHAHVEKRLRHVTHALCIDEADAEELRQSGQAAVWWPQAVPERFLLAAPIEPPDRRGVFLGSVYGSRNEWLQHPSLVGLLTFQSKAPEETTDYPAWFDDTQRSWESLLLAEGPMPDNALALYLESWRRIRSETFRLWIQGLQGCGAIVNLPSYVRGYAGRVYEGMAAGVPVVSWDVPDRPQTHGLFDKDKEILLFQRDNPEALAHCMRTLIENPDNARKLAVQGQERLRQGHTVEQRIDQIQSWIRTGTLPDFQAASPIRINPLPSPAVAPVSSLTPRTAMLAATLSKVRRAQGALTEAVACLDAALESKPSQIAWLVERMDLAREAGEAVAVRRFAERALALETLNAQVWCRLAVEANRSGQIDLAKRIVETLWPQTPEDLGALVEWLKVHTASSQKASVAEQLTFSRDWLEPWLAKANAALELERSSVGRSDKPGVADLGNLDAANAALEAGQLADAWTLATTAIQQRPFHPKAWLLLASVALRAGDIERAGQCGAEAKRLAPQWKAAKDFIKQIPAKGTAPQTSLPALALEVGPRKPRLTVCLITRDEERFISACLKSIQSVADQIVVLDTGSTDRTVQIAQELGAEVHHFTWRNDFSAARNAALEHARGDWILSLDADEELVASTCDSLKTALSDPDVIAYRIPLADVGKEKEGFHYVPRLFRNAPGVHFRGRIHEHAFGSLETLQTELGMRNILGKAQLLHHGYTDQVVKDRGKVKRNLRLLESALEETPDDISLWMSYGLDLVRSGQLDAGLESYNKAFQLMSRRPTEATPPELRERLMTLFASHLMTAQRFQTLTELSTSPAAQATGPTASLHLLFGLAQYMQQNHAEAAKHLRQCIAKRNTPSLSPILPDIKTGAPRHILAIALSKLGDKKEAAKQFEASLAETPDACNVRLDFAHFLQREGQTIPALQQLHEIILRRPSELAAWRFGAELALSKPDYLDFANDWTGEACKAFPRDSALQHARAEVLTLRGDFQDAEPLWKTLKAHNNHKATAAWVLCLLQTGQEIPKQDAGIEKLISAEFYGWFGRLVTIGNEAAIRSLVASLDTLVLSLPSATQLLKEVLTEAEAA